MKKDIEHMSTLAFFVASLPIVEINNKYFTDVF